MSSMKDKDLSSKEDKKIKSTLILYQDNKKKLELVDQINECIGKLEEVFFAIQVNRKLLIC